MLTNHLMFFNKSFPFFFSLLRLCVSMSQIMQHHGCRSHMRDRNKLTGLEDRFDLVVDSNDVILERVVRPVAMVLMQVSL